MLGLHRPVLSAMIVVVAAALHFAFPRYTIATDSMVPGMPPGSYVITVRGSLMFSPIQKSDVLVFRPAEGVSSAPWLHRIVALSGDEFTPPDRIGRVDITADGRAQHAEGTSKALVVPASFLYQSGDSARSYHGLVPQKFVVGKALFHFKLPWR